MAKISVCHPDAVSLVKVPVASATPAVLHRVPVWVVLSAGVLVEPDAANLTSGIGAELHSEFATRSVCVAESRTGIGGEDGGIRRFQGNGGRVFDSLSAWLVAVSVMICVEAMEDGAV